MLGSATLVTMSADNKVAGTDFQLRTDLHFITMSQITMSASNKVVRTDLKVHFRVSWVLQPENLLSKMNQATMLKEKVAETDFEWHIAMR